MKFIYTKHAEDNIFDRKISKDLIEETIINPNKIVNSIKGRRISEKVFGNRKLRVVYKEINKAYIVITTYYNKLGRYENE